ncbi:MAG: glycosyltransferase [Clostridia bacterium]|nr:glycosyltransferase [Clostridia bacterium]
MTNPVVSVIVPCYNVEKFLPVLFKCFNRQTYRNFQAIFVDDGSTDGTLDVLREYCSSRPQHTVVSGENAGVASARNKGLDAIKGELFTFCDADDIICDNHLELLVKHISEENADMAVCSIKRLSGKKVGSFNFDVKPRAKKVRAFDRIQALEQYFSQEKFDFLLLNKIYRTETMLKSGARFLDGTRYGEESYFICKYLLKSQKTVFYGAKTYVYLQHKNSLMHSRFNEKRNDIYINISAVLSTLKNDRTLSSVVPYVKVMRAGYSVGILYFILRSDYKNDCVIAGIVNHLKTDAKNIRKSRKVALYKKIFIPVCAVLAKIIFKKQLKKYPRAVSENTSVPEIGESGD